MSRLPVGSGGLARCLNPGAIVGTDPPYHDCLLLILAVRLWTARCPFGPLPTLDRIQTANAPIFGLGPGYEMTPKIVLVVLTTIFPIIMVPCGFAH